MTIMMKIMVIVTYNWRSYIFQLVGDDNNNDSVYNDDTFDHCDL